MVRRVLGEDLKYLRGDSPRFDSLLLYYQRQFYVLSVEISAASSRRTLFTFVKTDSTFCLADLRLF